MKELTRAINDHLAAEFQASHTYLAMSIWLRERDLAGFSTYVLEKSNEERVHAARMIAYLVDSDEQVELPTVEAPERQWPSVQQLFDAVYELEKGVTASINRLYGIAEQQGERSATAMLDWFVAEQLQEEAEARFVCKRLRLAGAGVSEGDGAFAEALRRSSAFCGVARGEAGEQGKTAAERASTPL
jgi:ferritin